MTNAGVVTGILPVGEGASLATATGSGEARVNVMKTQAGASACQVLEARDATIVCPIITV